MTISQNKIKTQTDKKSASQQMDQDNFWYRGDDCRQVSKPLPTISGAPTVGGYGASITIPTPDAANVSRVSLVKTGCQTHHYDTDMRLIWLPITNKRY